jgi:hypothetical protein
VRKAFEREFRKEMAQHRMSTKTFQSLFYSSVCPMERPTNEEYKWIN